MNLFENLQLMKESYLNKDFQNLFEMAKLTPKRADESICGKLDVYIYFSKFKGKHGPRIKFDGGAKETKDTDKAPTIAFDINGNADLILQPYMNKRTCPNAYDTKIINNVKAFIKATLPILLLTWFAKLDEDDSLAFLQGHDTFEEMLNCVIEEDDEVKHELLKCKDLTELHEFCKKASIYNF